jgi:hypothetical protein
MASLSMPMSLHFVKDSNSTIEVEVLIASLVSDHTLRRKVVALLRFKVFESLLATSIFKMSIFEFGVRAIRISSTLLLTVVPASIIDLILPFD